MQLRIIRSVVIERPVASVFDYVTDFQSGQHRSGNPFQFKPVGPPPYGLGTRAIATGKFMGCGIKLCYKVVTFQPNQLVRLYTADQPLNGVPVQSEVVWQFREIQPNRTQLKFSLLVQPQLGRLDLFGGFLAAPFIQNAEAYFDNTFDKFMSHLKYNLENETLAA